MDIKNTITVSELFSKSTIWVPRINGINEPPLSGTEVKMHYNNEELIVHRDRITFEKCGPTLQDFQFIFLTNEIIVGNIEYGSVIEARCLPLDMMQQIYAGKIIDVAQCLMISGKIIREFTFNDGSIAMYLNNYPIQTIPQHEI